jgi:hypothetical protein
MTGEAAPLLLDLVDRGIIRVLDDVLAGAVACLESGLSASVAAAAK